MDKEKMNKFFQFLKLEDESELDDQLQVEEKELPSDTILKIDLPEGNLKEKLEQNRIRRLRRRIAIVTLVVCVIGGFALYNWLHMFHDYTIVESFDSNVSGGTQYQQAGKNLYRYNSDGVSCVTRENEVIWSITYNMQAPISDISGTTMVIAEQQGNQIYVVNEDGLVGSFESLLPILKVRVSNQGVVLAVLEDTNVTWVNLYKPDGTTIASDKTTVGESGYPLDVDLSPNGEKVAVSFLGVEEGIPTSNIVFYNFGSEGKAKNNYVVTNEKVVGTVVPQIYFTGNATAAAVADNGFLVFRGNKVPKLSETVTFEKEIVSVFHDDERLGFLFRSDKPERDYRMELYDYKGHRTKARDISAEFDHIKIQNDQIIMYSDSEIHVFTDSGIKRFGSQYEKEVTEVFYYSEFRKYLVITRDSFDRIRISS